MGDRHGLTGDVDIFDKEVEVSQIDITSLEAFCGRRNCAGREYWSHGRRRGNFWRRNRTAARYQKHAKKKGKRLIV
jgi:hypothetical protein